MKETGNFIIRVYGLVLNKQNELLLTDEFQLGMKMTKFPGGGLKFGESTVSCLRREFKEECNGQELTGIRHFYTTDFYQKAFFHENSQLISIYYLADLNEPLKFKISEKSFDFKEMRNGNQSFRWAKLKELETDDLSFPIDKFVLCELKKEFT